MEEKMAVKTEPQDPATGARPCFYMPALIKGMADDTLHGPLRWYAELHVPRCPHCAPVYAELVHQHEPSDSRNENLLLNGEKPDVANVPSVPA